jgi:hypothetical protein
MAALDLVQVDMARDAGLHDCCGFGSVACDAERYSLAVSFLADVRQGALPTTEELCTKIHAGYEISYDCPQPTPMILTLSVHPSRIPDLLTVDLDPAIPANTYHDSFGNFSHVIRAPAVG